MPRVVWRSRRARFADEALPEAQRFCRRAFTFARTLGLSAAGRFSCGSCHVEGRDDGIVWFGPAGERQTPTLAGDLAGSAPYNWKGTEAELAGNIGKTVGRLGGSGLSAASRQALADFVTHGIVTPPNPYVAASGLSEQQLRGKSLFLDPVVGCAGCHSPATAFTDGKTHDVGTKTALDVLSKGFDGPTGASPGTPAIEFNTPSLRLLFDTAPYLHDGSAKSLFDVLAKTAGKMGNVVNLTTDQRSDLVAYLLSL